MSAPAGAGSQPKQSAQSPEPRIGLALSGGGFRASIFHLGAILRLEELGLMEKVAVISTVSGGSIVGVFYAIEMERCLQSKDPPGRIEAWRTISQRFLEAVDYNLRSRALLFTPVYHPLIFLKSTLLAAFRRGARSVLIQKEYDKWFFHDNTLDELPTVRTDEKARPVSGPKLVINTTSLISGERKAFERDANSNLAEMRTSNKNVLKLSQVVGASAGVPVLFPPTPIAGDLLVDGGVADNQGIEGLAMAECTHMIISDACGQLELKHDPSTTETSVLFRVNSVLQHQIRNKLMRYLSEAKRRVLQPAPGEGKPDHPIETGKFQFAFFHLYTNLKDDSTVTHRLPTRYIQPVARIRTDLDQFSHVERETLMYHGYTLADALIRRWCGEIYPKKPPPLRTAPLFAKSQASECGARAKDQLKKHLEAGAHGV
ncbi:MAG TPA: patatin-like phospholipase family protein, partial [Sulfuricaulis sp.]|nr:patatin-like phospholipase family protein [Sulfuricaulis sp.]